MRGEWGMSEENVERMVWHPRPSAIVAALYRFVIWMLRLQFFMDLRDAASGTAECLRRTE